MADAASDSTDAKSKPPYIADQRLLLLTDVENARAHLRALQQRGEQSGRGGGETPPELAGMAEDVWRSVTRDRVADDRVLGWSLRRMVVATDAGIGKTELLRFLSWRINRGDEVAFVIDAGKLPDHPADLLDAAPNRSELVRLFRAAVADDAKKRGGEFNLPSHGEAQALLHRLRRAGRITLLVDALDQVDSSTKLESLGKLLADADWQECRIVLSGRSYSIEDNWGLLGDARGWSFLRPAEFTEDQQKQYLGPERWALIDDPEAREILSVPRVLYYLRNLEDQDLQKIRSVSDVYWYATGKMLEEGMKDRNSGMDEDEARLLLGAIAFEMISAPGKPNFQGIPAGQMEAFKVALGQRCRAAMDDAAYGPKWAREKLKRLGDMNTFVLYNGLLEPGCPTRVHWRNKSLLEFFAAWWLAQFCSEEDAAKLWDSIYLPEDPKSDPYYWLWRYLAEMPYEARNPHRWVRAIEPVYRPGDGTAEGTKRSGEMIYRGWERLKEHFDNTEGGAEAVRDAFLGEFERILYGKPGDEDWRGHDAKRAAKQFVDSFDDISFPGGFEQILHSKPDDKDWRVEQIVRIKSECAAKHFVNCFQHIPAGTFTMGSPPEKGGIPEDERQRWERWIEDAQENPNQFVEEYLDRIGGFPGDRRGQQREHWRSFFLRLAREGLQVMESRFDRSDERPIDRRISAFRLNRNPTLNEWFRLYAPGHGLTDSSYRKQYEQISGAPDTPAIYVNWYDAWAFCLWAQWGGQSCRLPREDEWEYACKAGTDWDWDSWWHPDEFEEAKCNGNNRVKRTMPPDSAHANNWELVDMLGNVWEWCSNWYASSAAETLDDPDFCSSTRVLRGGSWDDIPHYVRSAVRLDRLPTYSDDYVGFRVARAFS